ncbi:hypothetical protein tb265_00390 [Gemmatimonadetes bacterium T265]|nr:hypothetical protein tb265_00390 [Gemmatimonadetes bacterium T265]
MDAPGAPVRPDTRRPPPPRSCPCCRVTGPTLERVAVHGPRGTAIVACRACAARIRMQQPGAHELLRWSRASGTRRRRCVFAVRAVSWHPDRHRRLFGLRPVMRRFALISAVLFAAACSSNDATRPPAAVTGAWALRSVDGQPLPVIYSDSSDVQLAAVADAYTLQADGTYVEAGQRRVTMLHDLGFATRQDLTTHGIWTRSGRVLAIASGLAGDPVTLTLVNTDTLAGLLHGHHAVYTHVLP